MFPTLTIFGLSISTYFLVISVASIIGSLWFIKRCEQRDLKRITAIDMTLVCLVGGFLGARLLHIFWEESDFYRQNPLAVLEVWNGGFVFLGGVVGAWLAGTLFSVIQREPFWFWADRAAPCVALSYALGRVACFLNGCCYGRHCELPWAIHLHGEFRHPTQLYATLWELVVVGILLKMEPRLRTSGALFGLWLVLHSLGRLTMEVFRDDPRGPLVYGQSLGTWMSFAIFVVGALLLFPSRNRGAAVDPL